MPSDPVPERAAAATLLAAALFAAAPAHAILTRADRDDAEYLELATRYPSAVTLGPGIEGVLIAPRWVLTTAHAAASLQGAKLRPPPILGGRPNGIRQAFIHPGWKQGSEADIALVLLTDAVAGVEATPVRPDADEIDEVVFLVGHGETGRIGGPARRNDGRKRAAINTVDAVTPATLRLRVKSPDEASDLQGAMTLSERGAPAFLERMGRLSIVGLFSAAEGDWQVFTRVSTYTPWIDETMFRAGVAEASARGQR